MDQTNLNIIPEEWRADALVTVECEVVRAISSCRSIYLSVILFISYSYLLSLLMISSLPLVYSTTRGNILLERQQVIFGPRLILIYHPISMPKSVIKWMIRTSSSCLQNEFFGYNRQDFSTPLLMENKSNIETYGIKTRCSSAIFS